VSCGIPNTYILDKSMYKMLVSFCSYSTIRLPNSKTLTGTYERGYKYILLLITAYVYELWNVKNIKNYAVMLRLVSDVFPTLVVHSWRTFRLLSPVLSGWVSILTMKAYECHLFREVYCSSFGVTVWVRTNLMIFVSGVCIFFHFVVKIFTYGDVNIVP